MITFYGKDELLKDLPTKYHDSLVALFKEAWGDNSTIEEYFCKRKKYFVENPYMSESGYPVALLIDNGRVIAYQISTPCKLWAKNIEWTMYWHSGLYLLKECRGCGLGGLLPQEAYKRMTVSNGVFVVQQQMRTHQKLGYKVYGKIPDFIKVINPQTFFNELQLQSFGFLPCPFKKIIIRYENIFRFGMKIFGKVYLNAYYKYCGIKNKVNTNGVSFRFVDEFDERIDKIWEKDKACIKFAQVRNSRYINWQFKKDRGWQKIVFIKDGRVIGYSIVAQKKFLNDSKFGNMVILSTIDMLWDFDEKKVVTQYLEFIEQYAKKQGADLMFCSINWKEAVESLKKKGYLNIPGTVNFVARSSLKELELSDKLEDWYITRGDADAAGSLGFYQ